MQDFIVAPSGTRLPITPKFKATATARYSWPAWASVKAHVQGGVSLPGIGALVAANGIALVRTGEIVDPNVFQGKLHAATLVDLFAGLDWPKWNVEAVRDERLRQARSTSAG